MDSRKITIVSTKMQKKSVIMSEAETLGQLKADLDNAGINYEGMTFYEGTSRVELQDYSSQLPKDVSYKGTTTNELVFMLTNTNKKIKSGAMSRAEAYAAIKANNLGDVVKEKMGKNFTMCSTDSLIAIIAQNSGSKDAQAKVANAVKAPKKTPNKPVTVEAKEPETPTTPSTPIEVVDSAARKAIQVLVQSLYGDDLIDDDTYDEVKELTEDTTEVNKVSNTAASTKPAKKELESSYDDDDIDDMFDFVQK